MDQPKAREQTRVKKPYRQPRLEVYGDLRRITENKGAPSKPDTHDHHLGTKTGNMFGH